MLQSTKLNKFLTLSGLLMALIFGASQSFAGYLTDKHGNVVKNGRGECWEAMHGVEGLPDCDGSAPMEEEPADEPMTDGDDDNDGVKNSRDKCPGTRAGAKVDRDGCEITGDITLKLTNDHFDFDSAELKPAMKSALNDVADKIKASKGKERLEITGHTCSTGPEEYNQGLSERRANAVRAYLQSRGIDATRMTSAGKGESMPVADNNTKAGRSANRRVEIMTR